MLVPRSARLEGSGVAVTVLAPTSRPVGPESEFPSVPGPPGSPEPFSTSKVKVYVPGPRSATENGVTTKKEFVYVFDPKASEPLIVPPDRNALAALSEAKEPDKLDTEVRVNMVV